MLASLVLLVQVVSQVLSCSQHLKRQEWRYTIASAGGVNSWHHSEKFKASFSSTSASDVIASKDISTVVISTRHDTIKLTKSAITWENVLEKPLCLTASELEGISESLKRHQSPPILMVGFNRRFAPLIKKLKRCIEKLREPKSMVMTVNAGPIPADHRTQDPLEEEVGS